MTDNANPLAHEHKSGRGVNNSGVSSGIYGLAFIGSLIYYFTHAATFMIGLLGFFKALFWPAFLVYNLLEFLKM